MTPGLFFEYVFFGALAWALAPIFLVVSIIILIFVISFCVVLFNEIAGKFNKYKIRK